SIHGIVSSTLPSSTTITSQAPPVWSWNSFVASKSDGNICSKSSRPFQEGMTMLTDGTVELIQYDVLRFGRVGEFERGYYLHFPWKMPHGECSVPNRLHGRVGREHR